MDNNINDNLGFGGGLFFDDDELNAGPVSNDTHMPGASIAADSDEEDWGDIDSDDDGPARKSPTNPIKRRVEKSGKRDHSADSNGPVARKKLKVKGGRAAVPKKVVADMDTDDEIIVTMKQNRCVDAEIAERLINEGRTRYDVKTIASRWQRLRRVLAERQDELLDDDLTDWHMGE
ncbi:hypothetical protein B0A49_09161, partial [Cryomyces minteri]